MLPCAEHEPRDETGHDRGADAVRLGAVTAGQQIEIGRDAGSDDRNEDAGTRGPITGTERRGRYQRSQRVPYGRRHRGILYFAPMTYVLDTPEVETAAVLPGIDVPADVKPRWNLATRVAFRFFAIYFAFYILLTQMFNALFNFPGPSSWSPEGLWTITTAVTWVANRVLNFPPLFQGVSGSGDKPYDYAFAFTFLMIAAALTAIWSVADRRRPAYPGLHKWYRLFLRWGLGSTMLVYGAIKMLPSQMPFPSLTRLLEPYGHFSLMGVLWAQIGASPPFEVFIGSMEVLCAILLFIPGLTTAGAILTLITMSNVFLVNMTYDVPVKLFSFHLILMSLMLLAPDMRRLWRVMVLRKAVDAAPEPPLTRNRRVRMALVAVQLAFAGWLVYANFSSVVQGRRTFGATAPKPALYGIWEIERMTIDGVERAPLVTDYDRWRRLVIQNTRGMTFQRMDETFMGLSARYEDGDRTIVITDGNPQGGRELGRFAVTRPAPDRLVLDGRMRNRAYRFETRLFDHTQLRLLKSPSFRWMQDLPFNR